MLGGIGGRDWGQEEKGTTEDEMVGWYHRLDGREFELVHLGYIRFSQKLVEVLG